MQNPKKAIAKAITGGTKKYKEPKEGTDMGYGYKVGYGENGRKLRKNYKKEQIEMASVSTLYKKKK
jgi:hypothetical protein